MSESRGAASVTLDTIIEPAIDAAITATWHLGDPVAVREAIKRAVTDALLAKGITLPETEPCGWDFAYPCTCTDGTGEHVRCPHEPEPKS